MCSDSYKQELLYNDACLECKARYITIGGSEDIGIGARNVIGRAEQKAGFIDDGGGKTIINVVHAHNLQKAQLSKRDCMALLEAYLQRVVEHLKEKGKDDRIPEFKKGATEMIKMIMEKFDKM